jgi:hypothetical protein
VADSRRRLPRARSLLEAAGAGGLGPRAHREREVDLPGEATIGKTFAIRAWVQAPGFAAGDLAVQMYLGR